MPSLNIQSLVSNETVQPAESTKLKDDAKTYFGSSFAPGLIIGASIFSIIWGLINACLVKSINMDDIEAIEQLMKAQGEGTNEAL